MDDERARPSENARLCELLEQQIAKLTELTERFTQIADAVQRSNDIYVQQAKTWEDDRKRDRERQEQRDEETLRRGSIVIIIFALIPVAIIVARFL